MNKKYKILLVSFIVFFILAGFLGVNQVYHQDEHRWVMLADGSEEGTAPHPPLNLFLLSAFGNLFGFSNLRFMVFLFGLINLFLIWIIVKDIYKEAKTAVLATGLFAINTYSLIASLQIDIDGALLPFFVLSGFYAYVSLREKNNNVLWAIILLAVVVGGLITKLSFMLFIAVMAIDYVIDLYLSGKFKNRQLFKDLFKFSAPLIVIGIVLYILNTEQFSIITKYAGNFKSLNFKDRAYFDLSFKIAKSLIWASPLLICTSILGLFSRETIRKYKFWYSYIFTNLIFYLVIFDFTRLTIERYFMFMIVPAAIISSGIISKLISEIRWDRSVNYILGAGGIFTVLAFVIVNQPHLALPLNPKSSYIETLRNINLNFLIPLTGGSGPVGFYFSAKFIFISWLLASTSLLAVLFNSYKKFFLVFFITIGVGYNLLFINEYLFGSLYGSPNKLTKESLEYIIKNSDVKEVITYYDIGAYDLKKNNKYSARFYTAPSRDYTERIITYRGHYMILDFPVLNKDHEYWDLISRCNLDKEFEDKYINSYIFDCRFLP